MTESTNFQIWLDLAQKEFAYACSDLEHPEENFFALTCFHFQQAAEKALKSFILKKGESFRKIHNLNELLITCTNKEPTFAELKNDTALLNPFYTETRYPVHWPINITKEDAYKAKNAAEKIVNFVKEKLKLE